MAVTQFSNADEGEWEDLVARAPMGSFLHSRRFLAYHGDRFVDRSVLVRDEDGRLVGVLPAAEQPGDASIVVSHPGATFGGLVHAGSLSGERILRALEAVIRHFAQLGYQTLRYRPVPHIFHRVPSGDDSYAMFRLRAMRTRCDLSCVVDLTQPPRLSSRRRRGVRKARNSGVRVDHGPELVDEYWPVLEETLERRYAARPVHALPEMHDLITRLPQNIDVALARLDDAPVAGVVLFSEGLVRRAQYIASSDIGYSVGALDLVFETCMHEARVAGYRYFDFGTSNRDDGWTLNEGLYRFKAEFGGGGVPFETYDLQLSAMATPNPVSP